MLLFWNGYEQIVALCIICFKTRGRTNRIHLGYESSLLFWLFSDPQNPQISDPADWSGLSPPVRPPSHSPPLRENFGGCTSMYCGGALRTGEVVKSNQLAVRSYKMRERNVLEIDPKKINNSLVEV